MKISIAATPVAQLHAAGVPQKLQLAEREERADASTSTLGQLGLVAAETHGRGWAKKKKKKNSIKTRTQRLGARATYLTAAPGAALLCGPRKSHGTRDTALLFERTEHLRPALARAGARLGPPV